MNRIQLGQLSCESKQQQAGDLLSPAIHVEIPQDDDDDYCSKTFIKASTVVNSQF